MKKTLLFLLTLISVSVTNAQIVNIPDIYFKNFLTSYSPTIDTNNDGEIQVTEAEAFTGDLIYDPNSIDYFGYCNCMQNGEPVGYCYMLLEQSVSSNINDLTGLEAFKNVSTIKLNEVNLQVANSIVINNFNNLTSIEISFVSHDQYLYTIPTLDLSNNPNLKIIRFYRVYPNPAVPNCLYINGFDSDLSVNTIGPFFPFANIHIQNLIVNNLPLLEDLRLTDNFNIPSIDVSQSPNLINLSLSGNNLTLLDVSNNPNLITLNVGNNNLSTLDLSNNTNLEQLYVYNTNLSSINLSNQLLLTSLLISSNNLTTLDVANNTNLTGLNVASNNLTTLDVSNNTQLTSLRCNNNNSLTYLNLKNGNNANFNLNSGYPYFTNLPLLETVCVDDINSDLTLKINTDVGHAVVYTEYCSLTPAQSNTISGLAKIDLSNNGCDSNDVSLQNILVSTTNGTDSFGTFVLSDASYTMYTNEGNFTTQVSTNLPSYFTVTPATQTNTFTGFNNTFTADFCIAPNQTVNDVNISLIPVSQARPGFDTNYQIVYKNIGTTSLNGTVTLDFDATKLSFLTASQATSTQTSNSITFDYSSLNPFETRTIDVDFNVLTPPTVNINDILNFTATIDPVAGDATAADNVFTLSQTVIGSYDPNDITVLEGAEIPLADADKYLHYVIRFQNTGTASAINVVVKDVLDANLDWSTIQLESASHQNRVAIHNASEIEFIFENINLPDSTTDEPNSHGFIAYKIKPKTTIAVDDIIPNKADIFFDYNAAITTNTATTTITNSLSINENTLLNFAVYPIPAKKILKIDAELTAVKITIYNELGQVLLSNKMKNTIDISSLTQGLYFLTVEDSNGNIGRKKIIKK